MAVVGLERTFYNAFEVVNVMEVCIILYHEPTGTACPIEFPFNVMFSTAASTAGNTYFI